MHSVGPWLAIGVLALASGCATRSVDVRAKPGDPAAYTSWNCDRLFGEIDSVQQRAADVAYAVDARVGHNMIALGLGVTVFWPALLAMRPDGMEAVELAELKGRFEAMQVAAARRRCDTTLTAASASEGAGALPVALGDRLVYEHRAGHRGLPHELGMRVASLRSDPPEFSVDLDGQAVSLPQRSQLIGWQRLLRRELELGQVLAGELAAADASPGTARVRGQVVAIGPQQIGGRDFDVAVIELFGDAPAGAGGSTRLDGVMSVDRRSGVLLRLELRCENANYALRRRLVRVEAAGG
ncbi:hypothetical protein HLB44_24305 [Aquincola sp. S2]|uniref:Lipoprotein n=1 Tax=Pseudaquabacterium terrae TaxID=2732868 RepID=A0ABX2ENS3_9BURK|nr:hypothetical protein [Aquabacterium terrae]NRF70134.1 hypothetical protein [Aquabacterium terrae]